MYASPRQSVIARPADQIDAAVAVVDAQGWLARRIEVDVASHHRTIDPVPPESADGAGRLDTAAAEYPGHQHHDEQTVGGGTAFDADYWAANLVTRCGSARPSPPPAPTTRPSSRSAHTHCSHTPSARAWNPSGPVAMCRWRRR